MHEQRAAEDLEAHPYAMAAAVGSLMIRSTCIPEFHLSQPNMVTAWPVSTKVATLHVTVQQQQTIIADGPTLKQQPVCGFDNRST